LVKEDTMVVSSFSASSQIEELCAQAAKANKKKKMRVIVMFSVFF